MLVMNRIDSESPSDVMGWLQSEAAVLWPAFLGSLSLRRSRCVRVNCAACLSGEQHQSYVLYDRAEGRRIAVLRSEGACSAGAARSGQRTGSAESAAPGGTALHQGTEARARAIEERRELNRVAGGRATDQFCRLGVDAAGSAS